MNRIVLLTLFTLLFTACGNTTSSNPSSNNPIKKNCPDAEIEWVDVLMINDVKYEYHYPDTSDAQTPLSVEKGSEVGRTTYTMADSACTDHVMENGHATFLSAGTPIYEIVGYPSTFAVVANERVFIAERNTSAKTAGEFYPLKGLVKNIYIESIEDGSRLHSFTKSSKEKFINAWYPLRLVDPNTLINEGKLEGERVFLEIELNNGVSFRKLYWADSNTFHNGIIGSEEIKEVITNELSKSH